MALTIKKLDDGKEVFSNVKQFIVIPYTDINGETLGTNAYIFENLLADSVSFTPDDNTSNTKDGETKDEPIVENIVLGRCQFAATSLDMRADVLTAMMGWTDDEENGITYAPSTYKPLYACILVSFTSTSRMLIAPKVKINSKDVFSTLKTGSGEGQLAGTCYTTTVTIAETPVNTPRFLLNSGKSATIGGQQITNQEFVATI